jgi:predicted amidohydrolase YtcJ
MSTQRCVRILGVLCLAGCATGPRGGSAAGTAEPARAEARKSPEQPADRGPGAHPRSTGILVVGGTIRLGAPRWDTAEALYIEDGRVAASGTQADMRRRAREPFDVLDLQGAVALPGLIDAHGHLEGLGEMLEEVDLRGLGDFTAVVERVAERAAGLPAGTWIEGRGWDQNLWPGQQFPTHEPLSAAVPQHPVVLRRVDGHALIANGRALALAGLDGPRPGETPVPGGRMLLSSDGRPTGVLVDNAMDLVTRHIPAASPEARERRVLLACRELVESGLTGIHDMGEDLELAALLQRLDDEGRLPLEIVGYLAQSALAEDLSGIRLPAHGSDTAAPRYRIVGAKLYMDGALGSRGAALLAPYTDEPGNLGLPLLSPEELDRLLARCDELRLQPAVHAIGDLANRRVLDAYGRRAAASPTFSALRPRIEHAQVVSPEDWGRFDALGVIPSMQPTHATSDMPWAPSRLGEARVPGAYAWRRLNPGLQRLAFGSDFPVESCDPLAGIYAAITCADGAGEPPQGFRPDQRLEAAAALAGFTLGAAHAAGLDLQFGTLEVGRFANLTVLDVDPLTCAPRELLGKGHVIRTLVRGETAFARSAAH